MNRHAVRSFWGLFLLLLCCTTMGYGQQTVQQRLAVLDSLIEAQSTQEAQLELQAQLDFWQREAVDSLYHYPIYVGKVANLSQEAEQSAQAARSFIQQLTRQTSNQRTHYKALLSLNKLFVALRDDQQAALAAKEALAVAKTIADIRPIELGEINYTIGGDYYALYDLATALDYFKASAEAYENSKTVGKEILADSYNGVAVSLWTLTKLDSARYYFDKAIEATHQSDLKDHDRSYYITAFQFNKALVIDGQGNLGEAIDLEKEIIRSLDHIIQNSDDEVLVEKSKGLQASAVSNLAAFYHDTGYLSKSYEMLQYSYEKKKEVMEADNPRLATTLGQIANAELTLQEFDRSISSAQKGLDLIEETVNEYPSVVGELLYIQARAYEEKGNVEQAKNLYGTSELKFSQAYPDQYSREYLIMLKDYALFLAQNQETDKAVDIAQKSYDYIENNEGSDVFPLLKEIKTLAEVYYRSGSYQQSLRWARDGNAYLNERLGQAKNHADSVQIEFFRPLITYVEVASETKLQEEKTLAFITQQIDKLQQAVRYLERRKTTAYSVDDTQQLLGEYKRLNSLAKQLHFEAFEKSADPIWLEKTIALHESGIYNRIRTQFNIKNTLGFGSVPASVLDREKELRQSISKAINEPSEDAINNFLQADEAWEVFLDSLKTGYPKYYQLRYATIEQPMGDVQQNLPHEATVLRYFYIGEQLYVFVLDGMKSQVVALDGTQLDILIPYLGEDQSELEATSDKLHQLYQTLWAPVEELITTERVIVIPDGPLFNLSFETLLRQPISSWDEMAQQALLAEYQLSYNYSLFLLTPKSTTFNYDENFVAFAPGFDTEMKEQYQVLISDSTAVDKNYLQLLPQPFSTDLVEASSKLFGGSSFVNQNSTKQIFRNNAREHKIIHIGTHAESNNLTPEFSRLIFAKDLSDAEDIENNSVFTYEIYDYNLASNLTILTACETGKPGYQPGEGMISLAHAFSYAGSESLLTSLWKIDEKSSAEITQFFYEKLQEGLSKDQALRQAKLRYLEQAPGRTKAPQYWGGLVLIGDLQALDLKSNTSQTYWIIGLIALLILVFLGLRLRSNRRR